MAVRVLVVLCVCGAAQLVSAGPEPSSAGVAGATHPPPRSIAARHVPVFPQRGQITAARRYARRRAGTVSFAVIDTHGRLRGLRLDQQHRSASMTKAMLLVAYLRRAARDGLERRARRLLDVMVRRSDNDAADEVYGVVGDAGLARVARISGMRRFQPVGWWTEARVTAADQARFFRRVRGITPVRHRAFAMRLLGSIVRAQRWGIPRAAPRGFRVYFKGGWRTGLSHQAALVERRRLRIPLAVLTTADRRDPYLAETIRGVAARLLRGADRHPLSQGRRR